VDFEKLTQLINQASYYTKLRKRWIAKQSTSTEIRSSILLNVQTISKVWAVCSKPT